MKKFILFAAILFAGVSVANAQDGNPVTGQTELTLTLKRFQHIVVNDPTVHLLYNSVELYENGAESENAAHLTVNSAGGYTVTVGAKDLTGDGVGDISASKITVLASVGQGANNSALGIGTLATPTTIISSDQGGVKVNYDVLYKGAGDYEFMGNSNGTESTVYTTTVVYTISAK